MRVYVRVIRLMMQKIAVKFFISNNCRKYDLDKKFKLNYVASKLKKNSSKRNNKTLLAVGLRYKS